MSSDESTGPSTACVWASLSLIIFIYFSAIFTFIEIKQFIGIFNVKDDFFKCRQPTLNIAYIISFLFVLYVLNPITLFLANVYGTNSAVPLFVNDIADILIFLMFFPRAWILWFDREFVDNLKNWLWRRELNIQDTNLLIHYRKYLTAPHLLVYSFYLLLITPIFIVLHVLPYYNVIPLYSHIMIVVLLLMLLSSTGIIVYKISAVSDEWSIRSELLSSVKTSGVAYTFSHILYLIINQIWFDEHWALLIELLFVCIADLCVVYYACHWTRKKYEFTRKVQLLHHLKHQQRSSFAALLPTRVQFQDIMDHKDGVQAFCNHLVNEFGLESMLFLLETTQFKAIIRRLSNGTIADNVPELCDWHTTAHEMNDKHVFSAASILNISWLPVDPRMFSLTPYQISLHLYDKYIEESADLCINISFGIRKEIYRCFQELLAKQDNNASKHDIEININNDNTKHLVKMYKMYDFAFTEIWRLIQTDSFIRFRGTEEFRRLISVLFPDEAAIANHNLVKMVDEEIKKDTEEKKLKKQRKKMDKKMETPVMMIEVLHPHVQLGGDTSAIDGVMSTSIATTNPSASISCIQYESIVTTTTSPGSMANSDENTLSRAPLTYTQSPNIKKFELLELSKLQHQQLSLPFFKRNSKISRKLPQFRFSHSM